MTRKCPFCLLEHASERPLFETQLCPVVLFHPRLMRGHLLIIPIRHVERLAELTIAERADLIETATHFQEKILAFLAKGCDLAIHYRPFQKEDGLKINHLHMHLQPRELFDDLYQKSQKYETDLFKPLSLMEHTRLKKLLGDSKLADNRLE